jgi:hypothetical protein
MGSPTGVFPMGRTRCRRPVEPNVLATMTGAGSASSWRARFVVILGLAFTTGLLLKTLLFLCHCRRLDQRHSFLSSVDLVLPDMFRDWMRPASLAVLSLAGYSSATLLYVASYSGNITTLNLTIPSDSASAATLTTISSHGGCTPDPAWLTLDYSNALLYCTGEGIFIANGSLSVYKTSPEGPLTQLSKVSTIKGPVSAFIYGGDRRALVLAH